MSIKKSIFEYSPKIEKLIIKHKMNTSIFNQICETLNNTDQIRNFICSTYNKDNNFIGIFIISRAYNGKLQCFSHEILFSEVKTILIHSCEGIKINFPQLKETINEINCTSQDISQIINHKFYQHMLILS